MDARAAAPSCHAGDRPSTVGTPHDLAAAIEGSPRLPGAVVRVRAAGVVEVTIGDDHVLLAWPEAWQAPSSLTPHLSRAKAERGPVVLLGTDDEFAAQGAARLRAEAEISLVPLPLGRDRLFVLLENLFAHCRTRRSASQGELLAARYRHEIDEMQAIGRALSSERDLGRLLALVLAKARDITGADAGSIYVVEGEDSAPEPRCLRFKVSQNDSVELDFTEFTLPVSSSSIVGRCVLTGQAINIADLYRLDDPATEANPFGLVHNRAFDEKLGYQTRSMLTVPMIDASDRVIGVIQLINKKTERAARLLTPADFDGLVTPFDARAQDLAAALASQAGISLENALLYDEIRALFEGFVRASVSAVEARDPTTSGHSQRVADLTVELARAVDRTDSGPLAGAKMSLAGLKQLEYAALLHDFGKIGVREHVLVKARKLHDSQRDLVLARFECIKRAIEADIGRRKVRALLTAPREEALARLELLDDEHAARARELDEWAEAVLKANEPTVLEQGGFERLAEVARHTYVDTRGVSRPYLEPHEVAALQVMRGSLTLEERMEIERHVVHTYDYLRQIPWGRTFKDIPAIAGAHHEKLDGTGYPRRLSAEAIPLPARMIAVADIYDALTASDRPYKRAVSPEKALDILTAEARQGKIDADLLRVFVDAKIWALAPTR